jgi:uncharacterized protein YkwD
MGIVKRITVFAVMGPLLAACANAMSTMPAPPPTKVNIESLPAEATKAAMGEDAYSRAVLDAINAYRAEHGIPPLSANAELQKAAAIHSADMSIRHFTGHFNPDGQGPKERLLAVWPDFKGNFAENVASIEGPKASKDTSPEALADAFLKLWIVSPSHRKNIREASYTITGIGIARSGNEVFVTQVFATP